MENCILLFYLRSDCIVAIHPIAHTEILIHAHKSELCQPLNRDFFGTFRTLARYKMLPIANYAKNVGIPPSTPMNPSSCVIPAVITGHASTNSHTISFIVSDGLSSVLIMLLDRPHTKSG